MTASKEKKGHNKAPAERVNRGLLGVGTLTERVARPILGKRGFSTGQIIAYWQDIVGPDLAALSLPEKIQFHRGSKSGGTLHLRVASGAAAVLVQPQSATLIDRVNTYLGAGTIARIKVTQGRLPSRRKKKSMVPASHLDDNVVSAREQEALSIRSDKVRSSLARLGARLKT